MKVDYLIKELEQRKHFLVSTDSESISRELPEPLLPRRTCSSNTSYIRSTDIIRNLLCWKLKGKLVELNISA